jgi:16S rRNA (cytosine1402-N4)-methyltransferase
MVKTNEAYHIPVMLKECLDGLQIKPNGTYVDLTFGGGGHSKAISESIKRKRQTLCF